jgi:large subunit ribosomal protein L9
MKVILREEIRRLGHRGETVEVAPGFARNYLFPQSLAYPATEANLRRLHEEKRKYEERMNQQKSVAEEVARKMEGLRVTVVKKAGEGDVLYGSVTASEIADALAAHGIEIDRRRVELEEPIKRLGEHQVHVRLHRDVIAALLVVVQPQTPAAVAPATPEPAPAK